MYVIADEVAAPRNENAMAMFSGAFEIRGSVVVVEDDKR